MKYLVALVAEPDDTEDTLGNSEEILSEIYRCLDKWHVHVSSSQCTEIREVKK